MERWKPNVTAIERARLERLMTIGDLAKAARISPETLSDLCRGRRRPSLRTLAQIGAALDLETRDVITFDGQRSSTPGTALPVPTDVMA